ncbi:MAG: phosphoenolpyruvate--protein phosphotransferase [Treponema sp.]|jgi:phosphotransferase system enzyme I (PtsI)|nr:phosphoenolpyruvate--protein phosphotransferase [Treponema sp.]
MKLTGKGVAYGVAVGRVHIYRNNLSIPAESTVCAGEEQSHMDRYLFVKEEALQELEKLKSAMQERDPKKAEIFTAHQEIVNDIVINDEIPARILNEQWSGDWAIYHVYETVIVVLQKALDPLIAERAADFADVRGLLLRLWYGNKDHGLSALQEPVILASHDLLPSDTANLDKSKVLAIITAKGGATSHTAIIAKSYGIPAVMGIQGLLDVVKQGQMAVVNADEGTVILDPEETVAAEYEKKWEVFRRDRQEAETFLNREGRTSDGVRIEIGLNITDNGGETKAPAYVDFVGLFRTEFLFMGRDSLPSEEEQIASYRSVLESFGERPVILRTIDIGGDKPISSMDIPKEENPFLGNRALRFCFSYPEIFKVQIRACLRAAVYGNLQMMLPMVSSVDDILKAKKIIASAADELEKEKIPFAAVKIGIMVEIPSIALVADHAAKEADFASIGTNDLCQYLCAADRMNSAVESYYQSYHPAVFKLIKETVAAFENAGKPVSICGELASDPLAAPVLAGLGLRKLSMGEASVASVKRALACVSIKKAQEMAAKVLECATAGEVKEYLTASI